MPYLIDGHNLIPHLPGLDLETPDDEQQLIELLQEFCRLARKEVEVFFDNAPPGQPSARSFGSVVARFVRAGATADQAIQRRLERLGRAARNYLVVSSDRQVQAAARSFHAQVITAEDFALQIQRTLAEAEKTASLSDAVPLSQEELQDWLRLFGEDDSAS
jgi:predicted RNA-binding protein with PIN domain